MKKLTLLIAALVCTASLLETSAPATLYHQTNPELLKRIKNVENPSDAEQNLMTTCYLLDNFGTKQAPIMDIIWQAITSVEMVNEILPRIFQPTTNFGYTALVHQCANMTSNIASLQKKQALIRYFEENRDIFEKLQAIYKNAVPAEELFLLLSRKLNEEEKKAFEEQEKRCYYETSVLQPLNENNLLIAFTKRCKQFCLASNVALSTLSNGHFLRTAKQQQLKSKEIKLVREESSENKKQLEKDIENLKKYLKETEKTTDVNYLADQDFKASLHEDDKKLVDEFAKKSWSHDYTPQLFNDKKSTWTLFGKYWMQYIKHYTKIGLINAPEGFCNYIKFLFIDIPTDVYETQMCFGDKNDANLKAKSIVTTGLITSITASAVATSLYLRYYLWTSIKGDLDIVHQKQKDLLQIAQLINAMQRVTNIIKRDPALKTLIPEYKRLAQLFNTTSPKTSQDLKRLINKLQSSTFKGNDSYYLSDQGTILATHHLFMRIKGELVPYLQAFGAVDAYLSTYKVYEKHKNHNNARMCLPEFIDSETPKLIAQGFWHPLIDAHKVVTNTLHFGTKSEDANFIITGPNAGGKTTSLMALIINIIMAQSFGIAPSSKLTLTPFDRIHSYLDITTNLLEGESLYKAEVNRAKKLKESIVSCAPGQKTFTIIDEIFSGTAPDVASKVGFTFAEQIGKIPYSMSIITTHFPRLTDLENETNRFSNYKVADAHIAHDGTVTYPFKLEPGKSTQNIAQHMLEQEGII